MLTRSFDKLMELYETVDPEIVDDRPIDENGENESAIQATRVILDKLIHGATDLVGLLNHGGDEHMTFNPILQSKLALALKCLEHVKYAFDEETAFIKEEIPPDDVTTPDGTNSPVMSFSNVQG